MFCLYIFKKYGKLAYMKKFTLPLFVLALFIASLGFNVNTATAANCAPGELFNTATGQACATTPTAVVGCVAGFSFSPITGQPCGDDSGRGDTGMGKDPVSPSRILTIGSRGDDVRSVQQILKDQGYSLGTADGNYGKRTARAVSDFQYDNDLEVTGKVNVGTLAKLSTFGNIIIMPPTVLPSIPPINSISPVISGVKGSQSLSVNEQGTWTVTASDPNGGNLSYSVFWGDEYDKLNAYAGQQSRERTTQQNGTISHIYAQAGNYTPIFTVTNSNGKTAQTSISVNVIGSVATYPPGCTSNQGFNPTTGEPCNGTNSPSVTVLSPNGGEQWQVGQTYVISYSVSDTNAEPYIYLEKGYEAGSTKTGVNSSMLIGQPGHGVQSFSYTVPQGIASWPGLGSNYKIKVCINNCASSGSSNSSFTINSQASTPQTLTLSVAPSTVSAANPSTTNVDLLDVDLSLNTGSTQVSSISAIDVSPNNKTNLINLWISGSNTAGARITGVTRIIPLSNSTYSNATQYDFVFPTAITVVAGQILHLHVMGDVTSSAVGYIQFQLVGIGYSDSSLKTTGVGLYGNNIQIVVPTTASANLTASLVTPLSTASQFVPVGSSGATNATKATFNFTSTGGQLVVKELKFNVTGANTVTSISVAGVSAPVVNGVASITGLNLYVSSYGSNQDVFVSYAPVGVNGIPSGSTSSIALTYVKYVSNETAQVSTSTPNISAPTMKLVGSKPTITLSPSSAALVVGAVDIGHVTVTADAKGDITLNQLPLYVLLTSGNRPFVKDQNDQIVPTTDTGFSLMSDGNGVKFVFTFTGGYLIKAGTSQTFKIFMQVPGVTNGSSMTLGLGSRDLFSWTDTAGGGTTPVTTDNGTFFYNYPTNSVSVFGGASVSSNFSSLGLTASAYSALSSFPTGCSSKSGFSITTGKSCAQ